MILNNVYPTEMTYKDYFSQGCFAEIISAENKIAKADIKYLIGALCLSEQTEKAENVFKKSNHIDNESLFFLGIGWTRLSEYKKARKYFLQLKQNVQSELDLFLLSQGMSFYNFFICRYWLAEIWVRQAHQCLQNYQPDLFWQLINMDLMSHIFVKRGKINQGIGFAKSALKLAQEIKNTFSAEAIQVSLGIYNSTYGLDQKKSILQLKNLMQVQRKKSNFYSYFNLTLEYIRRLNLNGQLQNAEQQLQLIRPALFTSSLKRQKALWCFRYAHLLYLQGRSEQSLYQIESSFDYLDKKQDLHLHIQLLGLKYKIMTQLKLDTNRIAEQLRKYIFFCKDAQSLSYAYRFGWISKPVNEDPFAQFFHQWKRAGHQNYQSLKKLLDKDWLALFVDLIPAKHHQFIYLDFLPKQALLFNEHGIYVLSGLTPLLRQTLLILNKGKMNKKEFVELIWGYEYDSLRHDHLIYTLLGRVREFLQNHSSSLILKDNSIELRQTQCRVYEFESIKRSHEDTIISNISSSILNYRQIEILEYLRNNRYLDIKSTRKLLHTTAITAFRDLDGLIKLNKICRIGRARATRYSLNPTEMEN